MGRRCSLLALLLVLVCDGKLFIRSANTGLPSGFTRLDANNNNPTRSASGPIPCSSLSHLKQLIEEGYRVQVLPRTTSVLICAHLCSLFTSHSYSLFSI